MHHTIGQLMAALCLICLMEGEGRSDVIREIKECLSDDMMCVTHGKRPCVIKSHMDVLDAR